MTMSLVQTVTVGVTPPTDITFANIPQTGQDLYVVISGRTNGTGDLGQILNIYANSTSNAFSTAKYLKGSGSAVVSEPYFQLGWMSYSLDTANTFASASVYIPNYATTKVQTLAIDSVSENNGTVAHQMIVAASTGAYSAAITSLVFRMTSSGTNKFVTNSTISLYTISTTGATGATVA